MTFIAVQGTKIKAASMEVTDRTTNQPTRGMPSLKATSSSLNSE